MCGNQAAKTTNGWRRIGAVDVGMGVAAAKAVKPANPSPHAAAEEEKESVKLEKPNEHDVEYTMDSEPDLADEPDDDELDMPKAADDPEKLAELGAL